MTTITPKQAKSKGYEPLTDAYTPAEEYMMGGVLGDMKRGNIKHAIVKTSEGKEIWRK